MEIILLETFNFSKPEIQNGVQYRERLLIPRLLSVPVNPSSHPRALIEHLLLFKLQ